MARVPLADYSIRNSYLINMSQLCEIMLLSANKGKCKSCSIKMQIFICCYLRCRKAMMPVNLNNSYRIFIKLDEKIERRCLGEQRLSIIISFK